MSTRVDIGPQGFLYPMPMTLVGADLPGGPNFMPIAWINRVQYNPPRVAAGLSKNHATNAGIREHGEFSVNIPSVDMVAVTDWCGLNSAEKGVDKSALFEIARGSLEHAPMIAECPLCLECRVTQVVDLGSHELFVADIVATWTEERFLDEQRQARHHQDTSLHAHHAGQPLLGRGRAGGQCVGHREDVRPDEQGLNWCLAEASQDEQAPMAATASDSDQPDRPAPASTTFTPLTRSHTASPTSARKLTASPG